MESKMRGRVLGFVGVVQSRSNWCELKCCHQQLIADVPSPGAVSYTHLTLPTTAEV